MKTIILDFNKEIKNIVISEDTEILGLWEGSKDDVCINEFEIIHKTKSLKSRILIKAILKDNAVFKIQPKLRIETGASQCDSYLKIAMLLLSKEAKAQAIPSLEILEKDVKAGHAATVGRLDREQLNYLQTRGLNKKQARNLLIKAFTADIISKIAITNK